VTTLSTPEAARLPAHTETLTYAQLALVTIARLALTTAYRILYPLLPFLSQQLDVDLRTVTVLVTVQLMASLASPLGGMLADTRGERNTMVFGLGLFCSGAFLCAVADDFRGFLFGYALIGLAMTLYLPAAQSYLSQRTPYSRRGVTLGIFEIAWAAAALIGVAPLMQLVQTTGSTQPVFWLLLLFGIGSLALIRFMLPPTARRVSNGARGGIEWRALRDQSVLAMLSLWFLTMFSYDLFAVAQSAWLKQKYSASEAQLGQLFGVIGAAELIGSLLVVFLVDRIGKRRLSPHRARDGGTAARRRKLGVAHPALLPVFSLHGIRDRRRDSAFLQPCATRARHGAGADRNRQRRLARARLACKRAIVGRSWHRRQHDARCIDHRAFGVAPTARQGKGGVGCNRVQPALVFPSDNPVREGAGLCRGRSMWFIVAALQCRLPPDR